MFIFKNFAAASLAAATFVAASLNAFAEDDFTVSYSDKVATITENCPVNDSVDQWTVVVIPVDKQESFGQNDIYYINQGDSSANFWGSDGLGLMDSITATDAPTDYIVRIGNSEGTRIYEGSFSTSSTSEPVIHLYGDVNADESIDISDAMEILYLENILPSVFDDGLEWRFIAGDVIDEDGVNISDAMEILYLENILPSVFDNMGDNYYFVE